MSIAHGVTLLTVALRATVVTNQFIYNPVVKYYIISDYK